jgi:hypothetical protein
MWGYPEFYIPVPGGYGTDGGHLGVSHAHPMAAPGSGIAAAATALEPTT